MQSITLDLGHLLQLDTQAPNLQRPSTLIGSADSFKNCWFSVRIRGWVPNLTSREYEHG